MPDTIENLQREFTDKFVMVDESIPELARFGGYVGQVKTVNMNGRALVQFEAWNNIGWYDIEVDFLKVVNPAEIEAKKAEAAAKPAAKAAPAAAAKPAAAAGGAKKSTADILAAARANKPGGAAPAAKPAGDKPAAKPAGAKMSTADILAAARAKKAAAAEPAVEEPEAEPASTPEAPDPEIAAKPAKAAGGSSLPAGRRATVPEILAWCREHDGK
jgi:hypothetical protein